MPPGKTSVWVSASTPSTCGPRGFRFGTIEEADELVALIGETVGLDRLRCFHLNDSKVDFGANRDRHENIGDGTIGAEGGWRRCSGILTSRGFRPSWRSRARATAPAPRTWPRPAGSGSGA